MLFNLIYPIYYDHCWIRPQYTKNQTRAFSTPKLGHIEAVQFDFCLCVCTQKK